MDTLLDRLLSDSAERWPQHPAIILGERQISYAELERRSNQLAHALIDCGCQRGDRVALLADKCVEAYVGIYGILKAGCAYVPLDTRAPAKRLTYIAQDCAVKALVYSVQQRRSAEGLVNSGGLPGLCFELGESGDEDLEPFGTEILAQDEISVFPEQAPRPRALVDTDLAYILYTSGSTGAPKGVMISHRNALTFVRWAVDYTRLTESERVSAHAPFHFDLSVFDTFATIRAGATLVPVPRGASTFPGRMTDWMINNEIGVWYSVPSALTMMAQQRGFSERSFPSLRILIFAGEVFPAKFLRMWREQVPHAELMNWYGPTETNVVTSYRVTERPEDLTRPVSIGFPCENMDVFLVDEQGQRIESAGQVGEVSVRGSCVALGYWGDAEKTQRTFLENAEQPWLGDRVYRTGDLASVDESGLFNYQGRRDHMVKSRGYRIELGEIEAALSEVEEVVDAVVIPLPDEIVGNRLVAVVSIKGGREPDSDILSHLAQKLPPYMVPERVSVRAELPKTSTGKIDRQNLKQSLAE